MKKQLPKRDPGRPRFEVSQFPDADWSRSIRELMQDLGVGWNVAWRLRLEARSAVDYFKPARPGRRCYSITDYSGVDWKASTQEVMRQTGLSRTIVYRLLREAGVNVTERKLKRQSRKSGGETPIRKLQSGKTGGETQISHLGDSY